MAKSRLTSLSPQLLLPQETLGDTVVSALKGLHDFVFYRASKNAFNDAVRRNVIAEGVLARARYGFFKTFALFQNLQNPLLKRYDFDGEEFLRGARPALETLHGVQMQLLNELPTSLSEEIKRGKSTSNEVTKEKLSIESDESSDEFMNLFGRNLWQEQAEADKDSLSAQLSRITTTNFVDFFYFTSKLAVLSGHFPTKVFISCEVEGLALLSARAMRIDSDGNKGEYRKSQSEASNEEVEKVAAQVDVLYEITHTYKQIIPKDPLSILGLDKNSISTRAAEVEKILNEEGTMDEANKETEKDSSIQYETFKSTTLSVAIFQGWLNGDPDGRGLRWKIPMVRDATEFFQSPRVIKVS